MTKRYFYTDALEAEYMLKHHAMKICVLDNNGEFIEWCSLYGFVSPLYIHPDSLAILEPQVGDLIERESETEHKVFWIVGQSQAKNWAEWLFTSEIGTGRIIQRNGKAFFTPEVEEV